MAKDIYSQFKAAAIKMLRQFGAPAILTSRAGTTAKGFAVFLNSNTSEANNDDSNSKTVYFQGSDKGEAPAPGDYVTIKNISWGIESVEDYNPDGGLTILFKMEVRKP